MNEEIKSKNFDINAKYEDMILKAKGLVEHHLFVSDGSCEAPVYIALAYDVKNHLPNLIKQNTDLKDNWNKLKEWLEEYIVNIKMQYQNSEPIRQYSLQVIIDTLQVTIDKMQEIEGGMNE